MWCAPVMEKIWSDVSPRREKSVKLKYKIKLYTNFNGSWNECMNSIQTSVINQSLVFLIIRGTKFTSPDVSILQVPMPLFSTELSHPAKEVIFNLAIYPVKTSIWQDCFNCPACEQRWKGVFIKRVSTVWTARPGIRGLKSASAPDSVVTPAERPRRFKHPLNDFHTHRRSASLRLRDEGGEGSSAELLR